MITNPHFASMGSFELFQDDFIRHVEPKVDHRLYRDIVDAATRKAMGFEDSEAFQQALIRQPMLGEYDPMFNSCAAFTDFCDKWCLNINRHYAIKKAEMVHFLTRRMGYMTDSDCLVDLLRMDRASGIEKVVVPHEGLFQSVDQFRAESQKLCDQLNSIKLSALRLAMAKAQGYRDVRAFESRLATLSGEAAGPDTQSFDDNTFILRREERLLIQGRKPAEDQRKGKGMKCWDQMIEALLGRLEKGQSQMDEITVEGETYVRATLDLDAISNVDGGALTGIIANFYYSCRDQWEAASVCERYMNALLDVAYDYHTEAGKQFQEYAEAVFEGDELDDVVMMDVMADSMSIIRWLDVEESVKQARDVFGDFRLEALKTAISWRLATDLSDRHRERKAKETIVTFTLTKMMTAMLLTLRNHWNEDEPPKSVDLGCLVTDCYAPVRQAMLVTFMLGEARHMW